MAKVSKLEDIAHSFVRFSNTVITWMPCIYTSISLSTSSRSSHGKVAYGMDFCTMNVVGRISAHRHDGEMQAMGRQEPADCVSNWLRRVLAVLAQAELTIKASSRLCGWNLKPTHSHVQQQRRYLSGLHCHDYLELCVTVQGQGIMEIEDRKYRMIEPAIAVLNPGLLHSEGFDHHRHRYETIWFSWRNEGVRLLVNAYEPGEGWSCPWTTTLSTQHQNRLAKWATGLVDASAFDAMRATLLAVLGDMTYQNHMQNQTPQGIITAGHKRVLHWVRHYLDQHYAQPINVDHIAELTCYSPHYLNTLFAQWTGQGIRSYLIARRMQQALELCQHTDTAIQDIAAQVGYDDPLYFSRAFRRYHGYPPSQARP
ncbi:AraC family transcriptional regulator [Phycisphaerales bacterium AB-hyl4]|uniref:AraC family transcriptional regulator n=1 Tax=Natronomicrosphaera hydrolytica TaxID=3242702 RepID=A0ABV4U5A0_9BACT